MWSGVFISAATPRPSYVCHHFRSAAPAYFQASFVAWGKCLTIGIAILSLFAFQHPSICRRVEWRFHKRGCAAPTHICRHFRSAAPAYFQASFVARGKSLTIGIATLSLFAFQHPSICRRVEWRFHKRGHAAPIPVCRHFRSAAIRVLGVAQPVGIREANGFGNE